MELLCFPPSFPILRFPSRTLSTQPFPVPVSRFVLSSVGEGEQLSGRERRKLRNDRRESINWRETVEERLMKRPKKKEKVSWTEKLNLDNLSKLGKQWWVVRVSRVTGHEAAERLARSLARRFPDLEFKVYHPAVKEKRKLKNGSISIKHKPLFPGCVFLYCILNKEIHDFIRELDGVGGFLGSTVGSTKRQINRPKPIAAEEIEAIFRQASEEQEKADQASAETQEGEQIDVLNDIVDSEKPLAARRGRRVKKDIEPSTLSQSSEQVSDHLALGSTVRVLSGPFTELTGRLKELDHETGKAKVEFTLFGKESCADLGANQIVPV